MGSTINVGERYRDCGALWNEWQVERIYTDLMGLPHAVVTNVVDPSEARAIACPTLRDRRRYRLVSNLTPPPARAFAGAVAVAELPA
ncbi:MAG: hypothetical protein ACE5GS_08355 [Kiloniellaceae bacterium]